MSRIGRNLLANFAGRGWAVMMAVIFTPLYVRFLGIEAYGLVGFYTTLYAVAGMLDITLTMTLNRELSRYSAEENNEKHMRDTVRTLGVVYWAAAILVGILVIALSPLIAQHWIDARALPDRQVNQALVLMGIVLALQCPISFYSGGLLGLQRQVRYNILMGGWYTLRFAGAVVILWQVSGSIVAFFAWQILVSIVSTLTMAWVLWQSLPGSDDPPRFRLDIVKSVWRFAGGMGAISITVLALTQMDKVLLSKIVSLSEYGYYILAWVVGNSLSSLCTPVFKAVFPVFTQLVALGHKTKLQVLYHQACQVVSVLVIPPGAFLACFAPEILSLWTGDPIIVENTRILVSLLAVGTVLNGLMVIPYALQIAHGWTRLGIFSNLGFGAVLFPCILIAAPRFGAVAGAASWVALNAGYVVVVGHLMFRRLLPGEEKRWYVNDIGIPLAVTLVTISITRSFFQPNAIPSLMMLQLAGVLCVTVGAAALAAPRVRAILKRMVMRRVRIFAS